MYHIWCIILIGSVAMAQLDIQQVLDAAVRTKQTRIKLPRGRIRVAGRLRLENARDLTIEGDGTTLVFTEHRATSWSIRSCTGLTLRGFAIDYDPLPFVQGRITSRSADGREYEFAVCEGFPGLTAEDQRHYRQAYIFEPDRPRWKPWVPDIYARGVEIIDARHGRFLMGYTPANHDRILVGDRIVLTVRSGGAVRMDDCENVRVEDVTFLAAPGAAYLGRYMRGDNYYRYDITPGQPPPGAKEPRLISTCADGLNIAFATKGPTIERCHFSFMGDDSVNLHGATLAVLEQVNPAELLVAWPYSAEGLASVVPTGSPARRLENGSYAILGAAPIKAFEPLKEKTEAHQQRIETVWPRGQKGRGTVFRLRLAAPLPAEPGDFVDMPGSNAPGFAIRDCVFQDHRARGLRLMASRGTIERNTFRRLKMSAITVGAEYGFWREAGWTEDVIIRDNTIEDVGRDPGIYGPRSYVRGAISIFGPRDLKQEPKFWPGNRRIAIENNTLRDCPRYGIFVAAARTVSITGNRLEYVAHAPDPEDAKEGTRPATRAIDASRAEDVTIGNNDFSGIGEPPPED